MPNLSQIETFVAVAEQSSFADAARSLSIPSSTVTARVKALENRLGVRLLQRTTRNVALTPEGEAYFHSSKAGLVLLNEAEAEALATSEPSGLVRVSIPTAYSLTEFTDDIVSFHEKHPKVRFDIDVSDTPVDFVRDGFDVALRGRSPGSEGLVAKKLSDTPVFFFATLTFWKNIGLDHLNQIESIAFPVVGPNALVRQFGNNRLGQSFLSTENFELARCIALSGKASALLPLPICEDDVGNGRLVQKEALRKPLSLPLYIVLPNRRNIPARVRSFVDHLTMARGKSR